MANIAPKKLKSHKITPFSERIIIANGTTGSRIALVSSTMDYGGWDVITPPILRV